MKFKVSTYIDKDNFDDFYHVDETGNLVIATEVYKDGQQDADAHYFVIKGPYDGSLGEEFAGIRWDRVAWQSSFSFWI